MRSLLIVSVIDDAKLKDALDSGADGLCLDLADRVLAADKARARKNAGDLLKAARTKARPPRLYVRVGGLDTEEIDADLNAVMPFAPDGAVLTRPLNGQALQHLGALLAVKEARCGLPDGSTQIIAGVGDAAASILDMGSLAGASKRLTALFWNATALSAALRRTEPRFRWQLHHALHSRAQPDVIYSPRGGRSRDRRPLSAGAGGRRSAAGVRGGAARRFRRQTGARSRSGRYHQCCLHADG